ncbi:MAG: hypothetical protein AAF694_25200 [Bacteroidota bacterium]
MFCNSHTSCSSQSYPKGYEYKSKANLWGIPLLHISFRYEAPHKPVMAKGIVAIGQYAAGIVNISQFGIGLISLSQFSISVVTIAQFAIAQHALAQFAIAQSGFAQFGLFWGSLFW